MGPEGWDKSGGTEGMEGEDGTGRVGQEGQDGTGRAGQGASEGTEGTGRGTGGTGLDVGTGWDRGETGMGQESSKVPA